MQVVNILIASQDMRRIKQEYLQDIMVLKNQKKYLSLYDNVIINKCYYLL